MRNPKDRLKDLGVDAVSGYMSEGLSLIRTIKYAIITVVIVIVLGVGYAIFS